jgi:cbb3-type cytochrome oxidase subunit 1
VSRGNLFNRPSALFVVTAACLMVMGVVFFHSSWPPPGVTNVHFWMADVGQEFLAVSGLFGIFAFVYFMFPQIFRRQMDNRLGQLHFWVSFLAVVFQFGLAYYFNLTFRPIPNEPKLDLFFRAFGASFKADVWAFYVFAGAHGYSGACRSHIPRSNLVAIFI